MASKKLLPTIEEEISRFEMLAEFYSSNPNLCEEFKQRANYLRELIDLRCSYAKVKTALEETIRQKQEIEEVCNSMKKGRLEKK